MNICRECMVACYITEEANRVAWNEGRRIFPDELTMETAEAIRALAQSWHARCKQPHACGCEHPATQRRYLGVVPRRKQK